MVPPFFDNDLRFLLWVEVFAIKQLVPIPVPCSNPQKGGFTGICHRTHCPRKTGSKGSIRKLGPKNGGYRVTRQCRRVFRIPAKGRVKCRSSKRQGWQRTVDNGHLITDGRLTRLLTLDHGHWIIDGHWEDDQLAKV